MLQDGVIMPMRKNGGCPPDAHGLDRAATDLPSAGRAATATRATADSRRGGEMTCSPDRSRARGSLARSLCVVVLTHAFLAASAAGSILDEHTSRGEADGWSDASGGMGFACAGPCFKTFGARPLRLLSRFGLRQDEPPLDRTEFVVIKRRRTVDEAVLRLGGTIRPGTGTAPIGVVDPATLSVSRAACRGRFGVVVRAWSSQSGRAYPFPGRMTVTRASVDGRSTRCPIRAIRRFGARRVSSRIIDTSGESRCTVVKVTKARRLGRARGAAGAYRGTLVADNDFFAMRRFKVVATFSRNRASRRVVFRGRLRMDQQTGDRACNDVSGVSPRS